MCALMFKMSCAYVCARVCVCVVSVCVFMCDCPGECVDSICECARVCVHVGIIKVSHYYF